MNRFHYFISLTVLLLFSTGIELHATHNRAGEITYEQIDELSIRATITTYTKTSSQAADRDSVEIFWGDGTSEFVLRSNGSGFPLPNDVKVNYYTAEHTYPGRGTYTVSMADPNRVASILNVNFPNSVNVPFYIETTFTLLNPLFQGFNSSAILLQPPIDFSCVGQKFIHNPNAFDPDGDSLSYELSVPQFAPNTPVPDYKFPGEVNPSDNNNISLDPITGNFVWDAPVRPGEYNIVIRINEYREGILINSIVRDMQILVQSCDNRPPTIENTSEICVIAGETIDIMVNVDDPDEGQLVRLGASGGPFTFDMNPARLIDAGEFQLPAYTSRFVWETTCDHISSQDYQVVFRAVDNFFDTTGLADLKNLQIKIVGPPPLDVQSESLSDRIKVTWESPYDCEFTSDDYFQGFSVWRKVGISNIEPDTCSPGLEGQGFEKIVFLTNDIEDDRYFIVDEDVLKGTTYCYRVLGEFARNTDSGNPFNKVASLPSDETCLQISRDIPLITKTSVLQTDENTGEIRIEWVKPIIGDLDTLEHPGPYRYQLSRKISNSNEAFVEIPTANFISQFFQGTIDTFFNDIGLNTLENQYEYNIDFYVNNQDDPFGQVPTATSVFLSVNPSDKSNILTWQASTPWQNKSYAVYREDNGLLVNIGETNESSFTDSGLENGELYCYYVESQGAYGIPLVPNPILNNSQIACAAPSDNVAPCIPEIVINNICNTAVFTGGLDVNEITWENYPRICEDEDIAGFALYYAEIQGEPLELVAQIDDADQFNIIHTPQRGISGCYGLSSIDKSGNESELSIIQCIDNCPFYELPNTFTPNQDGANDLFVPIKNRFIEKIELEVFNRWGQKIYATENPEINWDGTNFGGKELADGVYFYTCKIFEQRVTGTELSASSLNGYIHLLKD